MRVRVVGEVPAHFVEAVVRELREFYGRVGGDAEALIVYVFGDDRQAEDFYFMEAAKYGVAVNVEEPFYYGFHEAWSGVPRIGLVYSRVSRLESVVQRAVIIHEAAHGFLHGGLEYYTLPPVRVGRLLELGFNGDEALGLINILYTSLKDFEVSSLMAGNGYAAEARAYVETLIRPSQAQVDEWERFRGSSLLESMHLTARLKEVMPAVPLGMWREIREALSYMDGQAVGFLREVADRSGALLGRGDTFSRFQAFYDIYVDALSRFLTERYKRV